MQHRRSYLIILAQKYKMNTIAIPSVDVDYETLMTSQVDDVTMNGLARQLQ